MTQLLKKAWIGLGIVMFVLSCTNEITESTKLLDSKETVVIISNPNAMSEEQALIEALGFMENSGISVRSSEQGRNRKTSVRLKNYSVRVDEASSKEREARQEIPVYTINYENENGKKTGFVVLAGDERISGKILIFSEDENMIFDMEKRTDSEFLEDLIAGYLFKSINREEFNNPIVTRGSISTINNGTGDVSYVLFPPVVQLEQFGDPFTRYTPFRGSPLARSSSGCTAMAMSEIMAWHSWPQHGTFPRYNSLNNCVNTTVSYILTSQEKTQLEQGFYSGNVGEYIANILIETGYRLNQNYTSSTSSTTAYPDDVPSVFVEMGYTTGSYTEYKYSDVENDIRNRIIPVFMAGWKHTSDPNYGGHAFVITGVRHKTNNSIVDKFIAVNDGNGMPYMGEVWYDEKMFSTNYSTSYVPKPGETIYPYKYNCKIITNIKPNKNKTGSTNPSWRARSVNPY